MNKLIILTPSIIRGNLHTRSIGKFYDYFYQYLANKYEIYHIINIDEPDNLKIYFNKYETMGIYNDIVPNTVKKVFITEPNPGFLQAWKKIVLKIEQLELVNDNYLYYWLEDDWEPRSNYDITNFFSKLEFKNSAFTFTDRAPLGSFRGGPFMSGSYFSNIFNIRKYMNDTCDPERQMQRWLRGGYQKNGNASIHRFSIINKNVSNNIIHIIIICEETNIDITDLNKHHYNSGFDKSIKFYFHLLTWDSECNFKYSEIDNSNNYNLMKTNKDDLNKLFSNNCIKYFVIKPSIMFDIGREFNDEYGLRKWVKMEDNTGYANIKFYDVSLGNEQDLGEEYLRLNPKYTNNENFICQFEHIAMCLHYFENIYFDKEIKLNINYYSHIYGSYPNFKVFGKLIQLNYVPTPKNDNDININAIKSLEKINNNIVNNKNIIDINLINKYFKFDKNILYKVDIFVKKYLNEKTLGIYSFDDKVDVKTIIKNIKECLKNQNYKNIFIYTNNNKLIDKINNELNYINVIFYDKLEIHECDRSNKIFDIIEKLKININDTNKLILLENQLKQETKINNTLLEYNIINYLILLKCNFFFKVNYINESY